MAGALPVSGAKNAHFTPTAKSETPWVVTSDAPTSSVLRMNQSDSRRSSQLSAMPTRKRKGVVKFSTSVPAVLVSSNATDPSIWTLPLPTVELDSTKSGRSVPMVWETAIPGRTAPVRATRMTTGKRNMAGPESVIDLVMPKNIQEGRFAKGVVEFLREAGAEQVWLMLVLCSQSLFRFADLGDDGLCRGGPDKGCGVIVSAIDVVVDRLD